MDELQKLREENDKLRSALSFYASEYNWQRNRYERIESDEWAYSTMEVHDRGKKAREALGRAEPQKSQGFDPLVDDHERYWQLRRMGWYGGIHG